MYACPCCNEFKCVVESRLCEECENWMCENEVGEEESMIESMRLEYQASMEEAAIYVDDCDNPDQWLPFDPTEGWRDNRPYSNKQLL